MIREWQNESFLLGLVMNALLYGAESRTQNQEDDNQLETCEMRGPKIDYWRESLAHTPEVYINRQKAGKFQILEAIKQPRKWARQTFVSKVMSTGW